MRNKLEIKKDKLMRVTGYSIKLNGIEIPNKNSVEISEDERGNRIIKIGIYAPEKTFIPNKEMLFYK